MLETLLNCLRGGGNRSFFDESPRRSQVHPQVQYDNADQDSDSNVDVSSCQGQESPSKKQKLDIETAYSTVRYSMRHSSLVSAVEEYTSSIEDLEKRYKNKWRKSHFSVASSR